MPAASSSRFDPSGTSDEAERQIALSGSHARFLKPAAARAPVYRELVTTGCIALFTT
jgi:hypothetical protein